MELSKDDVIAKFASPIFEFIEEISNEPLTNSYYIEILSKQPFMINVTVTSATKKMKPCCSLKLNGELGLKNKDHLSKEEELFLLKFAAMNALIFFYHTLISIGVGIDAETFLIEVTDDDVERSLNDRTSLS